MSQSFIINLARGPLVYERGMLWTSERGVGILIISVDYGSIVDYV